MEREMTDVEKLAAIFYRMREHDLLNDELEQAFMSCVAFMVYWLREDPDMVDFTLRKCAGEMKGVSYDGDA
jgi:hypothetical protein